jgi:tetratricopeptide (TPR) repeat protein
LLDLRAQPGASVTNLPKPKKYERRILASEKSDQGKFNPVKRANQNLNTRYNFYFNSERKMNDIMANAKSQHRDNYSLLLPFYNYELDATASQRQELDSIIMRCNDAILLHDLRSDWVDDCYLMMGKAYFLRKEFDSAAIAFQYINFAFQPRTKDEMGYNKVIGSNVNETGNVYTISTKEKKNVVNGTIGHTPARNEAILWLLRTLIQQERYNEAAGLVVTLRQDVNFPSRLKADLNELQALMYYNQENYDSATHYLEQALDNAATPQEKARWEFLLAQMHENTGEPEQADDWYDKAIVHTTDPILEAYARIYRIRLATGEDEDKRINQAIAELMKLSKRDKYEDYQHIIYYGAGQMELIRKHYDEALGYFLQSGKAAALMPDFRSKVYLEIGNLAFETGRYKIAASAYDSLNNSDPQILDRPYIVTRKELLAVMMKQYETIRVEDSLQRIAAMPEAERNTYIKNLVRKLRKEQGLKEEEALAASQSPAGTSSVLKNEIPVDLFVTNAQGNSGSGKKRLVFLQQQHEGPRVPSVQTNIRQQAQY